MPRQRRSSGRWTVDSIAIIQAHKQKGHSVHLRCPISNKTIHLARTLFVDNTDLEHLDLNRSESIVESHAALQESIINWGPLLLATGGALKPAKCFYHMISFSWKPDGDWKYDSNESLTDLSIVVPLADGTLALIDYLPVSTPTKKLGQINDLPNREQYRYHNADEGESAEMDRQGQRREAA